MIIIVLKYFTIKKLFVHLKLSSKTNYKFRKFFTYVEVIIYTFTLRLLNTYSFEEKKYIYILKRKDGKYTFFN